MAKSKPKYWLVAALGPDGQPHGKAVGHVEEYGPEVPTSQRYVAFCYLPNGDYPRVEEVGRCGRKEEAFGMVREAWADAKTVPSSSTLLH